MLLNVLLLISAIVLLAFGSNWFLKASESIGKALGMPPFIIGMVLVGFGTSLPELIVSQLAYWKGEAGLAVGNAVGSNIFNGYLILGFCSLFSPLYLSDRAIRNDLRFHFFATLGLIYPIVFRKLDLISGTYFLCLFALFLKRQLARSQAERSQGEGGNQDRLVKIELNSIVQFVIGGLFLFTGGELLVRSGQGLALSLGIPSYIVSAIFVAAGTSFPELVTAVVAVKRGMNTDVIVGNIVGSNFFNLCVVLGPLGILKIDLTQIDNIPVEFLSLLYLSVVLIWLNYKKSEMSFIMGAKMMLIYLAMLWYWIF